MFKFIKMNPLFHFRKLEEEQIKPEVNRRNNKDQNRIQWVKKTECQYCTEWCLRHPWQNFVYLEFFPFKFSQYFPWQRRINDSCSLNYSKPAFTVWPPQAASVSPVNLLEMPVLCSRARPTNSVTLREGRSSLCFGKTCRLFWCALKSGSHCSKALDLMSGGTKTYGTCLPSCWISSDLWTQYKVAHSREEAVLTFLWGFWPCHMTYGILVP